MSIGIMQGETVSLRAPKDTVESLRLMLQRFEQSADPTLDPADRAELRRILMLRIANLEALEALKADAFESKSKPEGGEPALASLLPEKLPSIPEALTSPAGEAPAPVPVPDADR